MINLTTLNQVFTGLRSGFAGQSSGTQWHIRQGQLDGACGLYCAAMGIALLGHIKRPLDLLNRKSAVASKFWASGRSSYFEGMSAGELAKAIRSLDLGLSVRYRVSNHAELCRHILKSLKIGQLAIAGWCTRDQRMSHWVLIVGIETDTSAGRERASALLCLDPSEEAPILSPFNARIELQGNPEQYGREFATYRTSRKPISIGIFEAVFVGN